MMDQQEISDRLEINELMYRYGLAVDRQDMDLYRGLFTADAVIDYTDSGGMRTGVDATIEWLAKGLAHFAGLHHNMTNHVVEIEGATAKSCTYFLAFHATPEAGGENVITMGGFYQDRLARTPNGWRIAERIELGVWIDDAFAKRGLTLTWYGTSRHHLPPA